MSGMRILYLTPDFSSYTSAFYQQDVIATLEKRHQLILYGPGFPGYDPNDSIDAILKRLPESPDFVCVGHGWENQTSGEPFDLHPKLGLRQCDLPKVMILNKEYKKLDEKMEYIVGNGIDLVFTHHHDASRWGEETGVPFVFWPFAVNQHRFRDLERRKKWDLSFTGLLQNSAPGVQSDIRIRIKNHLHWTNGSSFCVKRFRFWGTRIFWSDSTQGRPLPGDSYSRHMNETKICLNTLSPLGLVGTRYFESMACRSLAFCNAASEYDALFEAGTHYVAFDNDLSDFDEKLFHYLKYEDERKAIVDRAYDHVLEFHTWDRRIGQFTDAVSKHLTLERP
jgi:glycosyltransferase involved in cell wall biosynthesis